MYSSGPSSLQWFAVRVKSNREYVTAEGLAGKGYDVFLPLCRRSLPGGGTSQAEAALFPGYLFSRFDVQNRLPVLMLPGVVNIVGFGKTPAPVDEDELESLRVVLSAGLPLNAYEDYTLGQQVRISQGPLAGASGVISGLQTRRLVVSITILQRSVSVVLEREWITPLRNDGMPPQKYQISQV